MNHRGGHNRGAAEASTRFARARRRLRDDRGAALVFVVVVIVVILGMAALVVDVGSWFNARREAQKAADAAALAGMQDLPSDPTAANTDARSYVSSNASEATATVTTPYNSDSGTIKVTVTKSVPSIFGGIFGIGSLSVSATAIAKKTGTGAASAVFAYASTCGQQSLTLNGNNMTLDGAVHTNGEFVQNSNNGSYGPTTVGGPNKCSPLINGNNNSYDSGPAQDSTLYPFPYDYRQYTSPPCTYWLPANYDFSQSNTTLASGLYCSTGLISFDANHISCTCSFMAAAYNVNSNNSNFTPYWNGLMLWETGTSSLDIDGNSFLAGTIFAPTADIVINGNSGDASGLVEGNTVTITGNNFHFTGIGPALGGSSGSLVG